MYRPPSVFTLPPGWVLLERPFDGFSRRLDLPPSKHRFGVVGYERRLCPDEEKTWELEYLGPREMPAGA
jgi:hypothetical protein